MKTAFAFATGLLAGTGIGIIFGIAATMWVEDETGAITKIINEKHNQGF